jgi:hypothetical protein
MCAIRMALLGAPALAVILATPAMARPLQQAWCVSASNLNRIALGDASMRFDCAGISAAPLSVNALGRLGWKVQAAIAFGDETTSPRAGVFLVRQDGR